MSFSLDTIIRNNIKQMKPYSSARDEFKGEADVYLDANENPFENGYNRYPDPLQIKVKERLAAIKNTKVENIILGNGSDEIIDLLIRACCEPGKDAILLAEPTYGMYGVCAQVNNVAVKKISLTKEFQLDWNAILQVDFSTIKITFICSPNNPSGNLFKKEDVISLIKQSKGIVVVDEAYIDFANDEGFLPMLNQFPNLVVMQTFSKAWGMAGLRLGIGYASTELITVLNKIKYPYNINTFTQNFALQQLSQVENIRKQVNEILTEREKLKLDLVNLPSVLNIYPSDANFLLVKVNDARKMYLRLQQQGIIVRDRSNVILCDDCLRITIGTVDENKKLIEAIQHFSL
ncbi:MAG: histidinol-phosphate transaminase [Cyclobacteriaceae bacterium]|jgi:histidinol-phosphate aminotransferase|nr:histidinol-phosphate transaminase [Cyclobacteriaceae bacterium]